LAQRLLADQQFDRAKELLAKFTGDTKQAAMARELEQVANSLGMWTTYKDLAAADPQFNDYGSIMPWRSESGSEKVVFVFSGVGGRMSLTQSSIHLVLQKLGCHVVYITDQHDSFYLDGTDWETVDQLCQKLRVIANELGSTRTFTLGNSSGGYAALLYGQKLGAEKVLAISPITTPLKSSWQSTQLFFQEMQRNQPNLVADLDDYYLSCKRRPKVTIAFGEKSIRDRKAAEAMLVVPEVKHVIAPGFSRHACLTWFLANDKFFPLLQDLLDEPSED
jgi:hypothetical protein